MPEDNQSNNQSNNQNNNQNNNQAGGNSGAYGGGKKVCLGADNGCRQEDCTKIQQGLEGCGSTVKFTCIDPNQESHMKGSGCDFNVFFCNGVAPATMWSFRDAIKAGSLPFTIFAFITGPPYHDPNEPNGTLASMETIRAEPFQPEHDAGQFMTGASNASMATEKTGNGTLGEWIDQNSQYVGLCSGNTAEELAQNICSGACGGGGGGAASTGSGGGAQIKDKTFEKCIRRICAATDSIFLVESNAAILFPYVDWMAFTLRQKINTIKSNEIDPHVFSMEYGNEGFYNKVSIAWGGATLPERYPKDEEGNPIETKKVTNYTSQDILDNMRLTNFNYDNWLAKQEAASQASENEDTNVTDNNNSTSTKTKTKNKKAKTTQEITEDENGNLMLSEQYDSLVDIYGEMEKRVESEAPDFETAQYIVNALLIQYVRDYNNSCKCRALNVRKYVGGTFYSVENPFTKESELFYLNSYTIRTQKGEPLYHDLDFKYGPEGAEELLDYQTYGGGGGGGGTTTATGGSLSEQQVWDRAKVPCHFWSCPELRVGESDTQDPQTAEDYYNKMAATGQKFCLSCYGMSAFLYYEFNYKAGIKCQVIGNSGHHVVMIDRGDGKGMVETREEYRQLDQGFRWDGQGTNVLLPAPSGGSTSGGNTASNNNNGGNRS